MEIGDQSRQRADGGQNGDHDRSDCRDRDGHFHESVTLGVAHNHSPHVALMQQPADEIHRIFPENSDVFRNHLELFHRGLILDSVSHSSPAINEDRILS
jgi:hypothetical protein